MKIVVTGVKGQLGHDVVNELKRRNYYDVIGVDIEDLDIVDRKAVMRFVQIEKPDAIIHCAAYTAVDLAEKNEKLCYDVNANGTRNLVEAAEISGAKFLYISTDYIFSGDKLGPYDTYDVPNPKSVYGNSKYLGELEVLKYSKHFIIRISWVFGKNGNNFIKTMLRLSKEKKQLNIVSDQFGSPTYTVDLSRLIVDVIKTDKYGTYHATNEGFCSWYQFANEIFMLAKIDIDLKPVSTEQFPTIAIRPKNSTLSKESLLANGFDLLPPWEDAVRRYLEEIEVL